MYDESSNIHLTCSAHTWSVDRRMRGHHDKSSQPDTDTSSSFPPYGSQLSDRRCCARPAMALSAVRVSTTRRQIVRRRGPFPGTPSGVRVHQPCHTNCSSSPPATARRRGRRYSACEPQWSRLANRHVSEMVNAFDTAITSNAAGIAVRDRDTAFVERPNARFAQRESRLWYIRLGGEELCADLCPRDLYQSGS